jgi:hypothetical protein
MEVKAATTTAQPAAMEAVEVGLLLDMVQAVALAVKAIPAHQAAIIGQGMVAVVLPVQVLECKVAPEQPAQLQVLVYLEQAVAEVVEIVQSIAETAIQVVVEVTAVLQIGATATTHTVKILAEDGA